MSAAARAPILLLSLFLAGIAVPSRAGEVKLPARGEIEDALPEGVSLSGREIFDRFLDKRQLGFPMVVSRGRSNDPFIGSPATGRVGRVRLSGVGIMASWVRLHGGRLFLREACENTTYRTSLSSARLLFLRVALVPLPSAVAVTCSPTSARWTWFPPEARLHTRAAFARSGPGTTPFPDVDARMLPSDSLASIGRGFGSPCRRPTSHGAPAASHGEFQPLGISSGAQGGGGPGEGLRWARGGAHDPTFL